MTFRHFSLPRLLFWMIAVSTTTVAIPCTIAYQGILTDTAGLPIADGKYNVEFSLYDAFTGGAKVWSEEHQEVTTSHGLFAVLLGSITGITATFDKEYWIEIKVNNNVLTARVPLTAGAHAFRADTTEVTREIPDSTVINANTNSNFNIATIRTSGNKGIGTVPSSANLQNIGGSSSLAQNPFIDPFENDPYGKQGPFSITIDTTKYNKKNIAISFLPKGKPGPFPVIFFCHGINETNFNVYSGLIFHIVSKGFGLVYTPYKSIPTSNKLLSTYEKLYSGFKAAVNTHKELFDTTAIGIVSHSYGGGATPYVANKLIKKDGWGSRGSFLYIMAPWYPCAISMQELADFPKETHLLMQVYDDDRINDPRIARALFNLIGIPKENKKYMCLYSDSIPGYTLLADHNIPCKTPSQITSYHKNALLRTFDLLAATSFDNDSIAQNILFNSGEKKKVALAKWRFGNPVRESILSDNACVEHPQKSYINFWDHLINPLNEFNMHFNCPKPIFFHTRVTLLNYWHTLNSQKKVIQNTIDTAFTKPETGFGSTGKWFADKVVIPNPRLRTRPVQIFLPRGMDSLAPVVFLSHAFLTSNVHYHQGLIDHLVSNGNIVIYVRSFAFEINIPFLMRYDNLMSGFQEAADLLSNRIDTTRIGFIGHGFAAGAVPAIAHEYVVKKKWGQNGCYLFLSAPWYMYQMNKNRLNSFPKNMKMIVEVFNENKINDWRIGNDIFNAIQIPKSNKNFIILSSDRNQNRRIKANMLAFCSRPARYGPNQENSLDYFGTYRLIDALSAAALYNDSTGQNIALGWNNPEQRYMGKWKDGTPVRELISTDRPDTVITRRNFFWTWNSIFNGRMKQ